MNPIRIEYENLFKVNKPFVELFKSKFDEVLKSGWYILGNEVEKFEKEFADYNKMYHCIGVASGLDALTLSIYALNIEKGSEIIVPSNTYIASILAIINAGCIPVLVEPDINTYNIDPELIHGSITKKTRAVMVVHLYGKVCDMDPILEICKNRDLFLIEDCAQAHGASYKGRKAGTFGDVSAFSFYPTKNLGALGDGGAVLTNNTDLMSRVQMLRNYGSNKKYYNKYLGVNSRLDELQAAFLRIKLRMLDEINSHKRMLAGNYLDKLDKKYILPVVSSDNYDVYHIFNIRHPERDKLKYYLQDKGIGTDIHYPVPPHKQEAMKMLHGNKYPISEEIHDTTLSLPISFSHNKSEISEIINTINKF